MKTTIRVNPLLPMLKQFIEQLSRDLDFSETLAPKDDGSYDLSLEQKLQISLRENSESGITLFAVLAPLPEENTEDFLRYALSSNLLCRETGEGFLGVDKEEKRITFSCFLSSNITYKEFHNALEDFVNYAESWRFETNQFVKKGNE